jgi:hypothetical protein
MTISYCLIELRVCGLSAKLLVHRNKAKEESRVNFKVKFIVGVLRRV